jgi:hypothetical protein
MKKLHLRILAVALLAAACGTEPPTNNAGAGGTGGAGGAGGTAGTGGTTGPGSGSDCVDRILVASCAHVACHGEARFSPRAGLDLKSPGVVSRLLNVPASPNGIRDATCEGMGPLINSQNPPESLLLKKLEATPPCGGSMPDPKDATDLLPEADRQCFRDWVAGLGG